MTDVNKEAEKNTLTNVENCHIVLKYRPRGYLGASPSVQKCRGIFEIKIKPKSDYPLKTLYPRAFQTGQNHLIYYDFTTVE